MFSFYKAAWVLLASLAWATIPMQALAQQGVGREFAPGLRRLSDLPQGKFRTKLERLPAPARDRALSWLGTFHFTTDDLPHLNVDQEGGVYYVDDFPVPAGIMAAEVPVTSEASVPASPFPESLVFHSKPEATNIIYLNFAGEIVTGTAWNISEGRASFAAVSFSSDSDHSTFSDSEQVVIKKVWQRVAEDFAPFNVNVTTERPGLFTERTAHVLITRNMDANGQPNPATNAGGVAYINVFGNSMFPNYRPAWVYYNNLSGVESFIAEAASHEAGHNLGLTHDATTLPTDYYNGHGSGETSWGPIMGTGYNRNVSQWSKGEYYLANNSQDDLAIMDEKIGYREDDHGGTAGTATALHLSGDTNIVSTTPENDPGNTNAFNKGIIEGNTDVDVFSFATGNGLVSLAASPWVNPSGTKGGNVDILLRLFNADGQLVLTNNAGDKTSAIIETVLSEGVYYLHVAGTGAGNPTNTSPTGYTSYGSAGQYFLSGNVVASVSVIPPGAELEVSDIDQTGTSAKEFSVTYLDDIGIDVSTIDSADIVVTGPNGFSAQAVLVSVDAANNGTPRNATYSINPPNLSTWTKLDNGIYTVTLAPDQVADTEGAHVPGQELGTFNVSLPDVIYFAPMDVNPGWTLSSQWQYGTPSYSSIGPTNGYTGTNIIGYNLAGNYPKNLPMVYVTTPAIDCTGTTSLVLKFQRWLRLRGSDRALIQVSTNGVSWTMVWSTTTTVADNSWQEIQYALPKWTFGSSSLRLRWGLTSNSRQNDIGWNIDDVEISGERVLPVETSPAIVLSTQTLNVVEGNRATVKLQLSKPPVSPVTVNINKVSGDSDLVLEGMSNYVFTASNWSNEVAVRIRARGDVYTEHGSAVFEFSGAGLTPVTLIATEVDTTLGMADTANLVGANGIPLWQSYIAGLDPNNASSQLKLNIRRNNGETVLSWKPEEGRIYSIIASSNPEGPFVTLANLPAETSSLSIPGTNTLMFYRLEVSLENGN